MPLSLTNRQQPLDPKDRQPKVANVSEPVTTANKPYQDHTIFVKKSRTNFGGGFKIPEEFKTRQEEKKALAHQKRLRDAQDDDSDEIGKGDISLVTKDEILQVLNLGASEGTISGKGGSKGALTNDLAEGLDKDMKKFRMVEDNIKNRQIMK